MGRAAMARALYIRLIRWSRLGGLDRIFAVPAGEGQSQSAL